jgi:hypothetical protein
MRVWISSRTACGSELTGCKSAFSCIRNVQATRTVSSATPSMEACMTSPRSIAPTPEGVPEKIDLGINALWNAGGLM